MWLSLFELLAQILWGTLFVWSLREKKHVVSILSLLIPLSRILSADAIDMSLVSYVLIGGFFIGSIWGNKHTLQLGLLLKSIDLTLQLWLWTPPSLLAPLVDSMGRPLGHNLDDPRSLELLSTANSMMGMKGTLPLGLGALGAGLFAFRVFWGILVPLVLSLRAKDPIPRKWALLVFIMILVAELVALFFNSQLGWKT